MRTYFVILALLITGCTRSREPFDGASEAVVFTNDIALDHDVVIGIRKTPDGCRLAAYRLVWRRGMLGRLHLDPVQLVSEEVSDGVFEHLDAVLTSSSLADAASHYPRPALDGWTWRFRRVHQGRSIEYSFFTPEWQKDVQGISTVLDLGGAFVEAAELWSEFPRLKRPNKSLQPTATAVMPPAAQEIMPAVAVAEH
jgi:hypothetical protein